MIRGTTIKDLQIGIIRTGGIRIRIGVISIGIGGLLTGSSNMTISTDGIIGVNINVVVKGEAEVDHHHGKEIREIRDHLIDHNLRIRSLLHRLGMIIGMLHKLI